MFKYADILQYLSFIKCQTGIKLVGILTQALTIQLNDKIKDSDKNKSLRMESGYHPYSWWMVMN